jgi:SAM-dependent methyltransferase
MIAWQTRKDRLAFPLLIFLSSAHARALGLTPIAEERVALALGRCRGRLLDIGCGTNVLARRYRARQGLAIGVAIHPWLGTDVVCDTTRRPFPDGHFDTVLMLACLNHVPRSQRVPVLQEARRVLTGEGHLLLTMINPGVGCVSPPIRRRYDLEQLERGLGAEEAKGLWAKAVNALLATSRLRLTETIPFVFGLNGLDVVEPDRPGDHRP